jgi:hypothetical protein
MEDLYPLIYLMIWRNDVVNRDKKDINYFP